MLEELKYWFLKDHKLFERLSEEDYAGLSIISDFKKANKHEIIPFSHDGNNRLFVIKQGTLKICRLDKSNREVIVELLTQNDIFGCTNLFGNNPYNYSEFAQVLSEEVKICSFETSKFKTVLDNNPKLSSNYSALVNDKMISFQQKYSDLIFKDPKARVAHFFCKYASYHGTNNNGRVTMEMMLTHQEIADYIASSRQSVSQAISELSEAGLIIYKNRKTVIIPELHLLEKIA